MSGDYAAYLVYGIRIPDVAIDELDEKLDELHEDLQDGWVGYLHTGDYDRDMTTHLVTTCVEIRLGCPKGVTPQTVTTEQYATWDAMLKSAAAVLGVEALTEPGWIVIPSLS